MRELYAITVEYGHQVEQLLERLGATGPARGAGERLVQVEHRLSPEAVRAVRSFLRLRNRVIHNRPAWMSMPTPEQLEQAGRKAVGALEYALGSRAYSGPAYRRMAATAPEAPGPVYRLVPRGEDYELWVGPTGVWVAALQARKRKEIRLAVEERLRKRFSWLTVRAACYGHALERKARYGRAIMSADEVKEAVRLLLQPAPAPTPPRPSRSASARPEYLMRRVVLDGTPAIFYVGPVGVLAVAEHAQVAEAEARRVMEDSAGMLPVLPVVRAPHLKEAQGRVDGVLALRDEAAIKEYLCGKYSLDESEVNQVAGWLYNRQSPLPVISPKDGQYHLKGEEVIGGREQAPPAFVVELVPPGRPPVRLAGLMKKLVGGWRVVFLPQLAAVIAALLLQWDERPTSEMVLALALLVFLLFRLGATFGPDPLYVKSRLLLAVGGLELLLAGALTYTALTEKGLPGGMLVLAGLTMFVFLVLPGVASLLRVYWLGKMGAQEELELSDERVRI